MKNGHADAFPFRAQRRSTSSLSANIPARLMPVPAPAMITTRVIN